jgi:hypothetical protein
MKLWKEGHDSSWRLTGEKVFPQDGIVMRRWSRNWFDQATQLEHTEDRYENIRDGKVIASEYHARSPATREYTQEQAQKLYADAGFVDIEVCQGFSRVPASIGDALFTVLGRKQGELSQGN